MFILFYFDNLILELQLENRPGAIHRNIYHSFSLSFLSAMHPDHVIMTHLFFIHYMKYRTALNICAIIMPDIIILIRPTVL